MDRLTDEDEAAIVAAHLERQESAEGKRRPAPQPPPDPFKEGLPPRGAFVARLLATDGMTAAHWNTVYDRLEAARSAHD